MSTSVSVEPRLRRAIVVVLAAVFLPALPAAAIWSGSDGPVDYNDVTGFTYAEDRSPSQDYSYSWTSRRYGTASVGVKNVYQEFMWFHWENVRTASDMNSGSYAYASQVSPRPSTCRNGRFVGDHYSGNTKRGSTTVDPPFDNCP